MALVAALSSTFVLRTLQVTSLCTDPTGADRFAFGQRKPQRTTCTTPKGYKGKPPVVALNDNYKDAALPTSLYGKYNHLHFPDGPHPPKQPLLDLRIR